MGDVNAIVRMDRSAPDDALFDYELDIFDDINSVQRELLLDAVSTCPVSEFIETFELAPPGKPFEVYSQNHFKRVK